MNTTKARVPNVTATVTAKTISGPSFPFCFAGALATSTSPTVATRYDMKVSALSLYLTTTPSTGQVSVELIGTTGTLATATIIAGSHFVRVPLDITLAGYENNKNQPADTFYLVITQVGAGAANLYGELEIG